MVGHLTRLAPRTSFDVHKYTSDFPRMSFDALCVCKILLFAITFLLFGEITTLWKALRVTARRQSSRIWLQIIFGSATCGKIEINLC